MADFGADSAPDTRIAIIGRAGRFPAARNVAEFWTLLLAGRSAARRLNEAELLAAGVSRKALADPDYVRMANILPDMECFDAGFWGFSPREASILDPQHRHFLETAWEAFEDAGRMPEDFIGRIGVYAGSGMQAYLPFNLLSNPELVEEIGLFLLRHTGNDKDFLTTRLSYLLNLTGPSVAVQTACSTSLVAVHMAVNALLNMECEMAVAGGVTIELPHRQGYRYSEGEILSPDGLCRAFDDASQGTVFGSGSALVVLRRLEDALADGDDIKAVILGTAINNDGAGKASYLAPSVDGQAEAAAEALALAGVAAGAISYIETHGTGTPIGDPIELAALQQVYGTAPVGSIGIGSVKTNIGHLDTAAGGASLIKVIEAMRQRRLPASLNFTTPNSRFDFDGSPFRVIDRGREWIAEAEPRRAAVNSLGVGGTNAHVIVEEAPPPPERPAPKPAWRVFPFSARTTGALGRTAEKWAPFLAETSPDPADIAFTLRVGRRPFAERMAIAARGPDDLARALDARTSPYVQRGHAAAEGKRPKIVFLFPGGGAQYPGAGAEMRAASQPFASAIADCLAELPADAPPDLAEMMFERGLDDADARAALARSSHAIPALFILEYAYAKHWESWGIQPDAILAHSVGEYAGAVIANAMGLRDALRIVCLRGRLMDAAPAGAMTTVPLCAQQVKEMLGETLDIAAINSVEATVVSGPLDEIAALEARLADSDHPARRIHIDVAAHSRQLDGQLEAFRAGFDGVAFGKTAIPMVSSLRGTWGAGDDFVSADYWVRHLRQPVRFTEAVAAAFAQPDWIVIEVGPGQTMGPLVGLAPVAHRPIAILPSAPRPRDIENEMGVVAAAFGGLWANGYTVDWDRLNGPEGRRVSLPTYPFEKERHWIEPGRGSGAQAADAPLTLTRIADPSNWVEEMGWMLSPRAGATLNLRGRWLVFAGDDAISAAVLERLSEVGAKVTILRSADAFSSGPDGFSLRPDAPEDYERLGEALGTVPPRILSLWPLAPGHCGQAFDTAYLLARMVQEMDAASASHLAFATTGAASVLGEPVTDPAAMAAFGAVRVAPREVPGLTAALIDIADFAAPGDAARALLEEAAGPGDSDHVALRGLQRHIRTRRPAPAPLPDGIPPRLRKNGIYLITGGTGGIGRQMALWLARIVGARLVLLSRSARPDPVLETAITAAGGEVMFVAADVTDKAATARAVKTAQERFGKINGVIHAAGLLADAPLAAKTLAEARATSAPKLQGGMILDALFPAGTLDLFAVISSSSVVIGGAGQTDYVAANAVLETLAAGRADGLSIAWGVWRDTGMAARHYGAGAGAGNAVPGSRSDDPDGTVRFVSVIDPETDWRVAEHVVAGIPVLPGTAYLEFAQAAARDVTGGEHFEIQALSFSVPLVFSDTLPRQISVVLNPVHGGHELRIESRTGPASELVEHARAQVRIIGSVDRTLPRTLAAPVSLPVSPRSGHAPQERLIAFGPRWNNVGDLRVDGDISEGMFALPTAFSDDLIDHNLHPALLDMAATVGLNTLDGQNGGIVYVPMSVDRIRVFGPLPAQVISRAVKVAGEAGKFVAFDVVISTPDGSPVVILEHLALKAVAGGALGSAPAILSLTEQLLAGGIRTSDADDILPQVFAHPARQLVVSPIAPDLIRLAMAEAAQPQAGAPARMGAGGSIADPLAARIAEIWGEILGIGDIGATDDFFALGGHSLNAVRMFSRIRKDFGVSLPLATLFEAPCVTDLARVLAERGVIMAPIATNIPSAPSDAPSEQLPQEKPAEVRVIAMTESQREIAGAIQIDPESSLSYNLSFSLHMRGTLDRCALEAALQAVVARHDSLRAGYDPHGYTVTIRPEGAGAFEEMDLSGMAPEVRAAARDNRHSAIANAHFDLDNGPLLRALLVRLSDTRAELVVFVHHIACDGWSMGVVMRDLAAFYSAARRGEVARLAPPGSIADLMEAERAWLRQPEAAEHRDYWISTFANGIPAMDLPTDRPHPPTKTTNAARVESPVDPALERGLRIRAKEAQTSLRNLVFAAFQLYLALLTRSADVVVGLPSSGQLSHRLDGVVGHGVNFLPVRTRIDKRVRMKDFLADVRRNLLSAMDHQNYTYGALMRDMNVVRDPSRVAIVPVVVNIDNLAEPLQFEGLDCELVANSTGHEHFELFFNLLDAPGRVNFTWNYNTDLFDETTILQHAANFRHLLREIAAASDGLDTPIGALLVGDARPASGRREDPGASGPQAITEVFRSVAARMPGRCALRYGAEQMDYAALDAASDALAALLVAEGVAPGDLVGISSHRALALPVAVLGVLKAGAGYVPFDTELPAERLEFMARDTGIRVLLGACAPVSAMGIHTIPHSVFPAAGAAAPKVAILGDGVAYVMYTSGTTGTPKGVVLPHRSVIRMLVDTDWLRLGPDTVTLHSSAFAFDTSIIDLFGALLHGGTVVIPHQGPLSIADLSAAVESHGVNTLWLTSGLFHAVADARPEAFARVDQVIVGGDIVSPLHVTNVREVCPGVRIINGYGPTESNVTNAHEITAADLSSGQSLPIGRAVPGTQIYILDDAQQPVPTGMIGELCIAGRGLALGYWNRPDLTAEKFIIAPWDPNLRLYRSGDLVMDPGNGVLRFYGRMDTQVKIRGFRVELSEIEAALESHPGVRQAVALAVVPEGQADKILVGYFVAEGAAPRPAELAAHLKPRLPAFAQPAFFVQVEEIPLNSNGKVDRRQLPPFRQEDGTAGADNRPQSVNERRLAAIWVQILGHGGISATSNFFMLGGHSLLAVRLFDRIRKEFGVDLPISTLFQNQTLRDLAAILPDPEAAIGMPMPATAQSADPEADWDTSTVIHSGPGTGAAPPLFIVGGVGGNVNNLFELGSVIGRKRPVIGFQTRGVQGHTPRVSIEEMAAENIRYLRQHQPNGPYLLAGYSGGAFTGLEMARQLETAHETVARLFVLDTFAPGFAVNFVPKVRPTRRRRVMYEIRLLRTEGPSYLFERVSNKLRNKLANGPGMLAKRLMSPSLQRYHAMEKAWRAAASVYKGGAVKAPITLFLSRPIRLMQELSLEVDPTLGWAAVASGDPLDLVQVGSDHLRMLHGESALKLAELIEKRSAAVT